MSNHRVLFLHKWFSLAGGVERVHRNLATALAGQGVRSSFYVQQISGTYQGGFDNLKREFAAIAAPQSAGSWQRLQHLFNHIRTERISVIIAATETANMLALLCALRFPRLKVIYTRHCAFDVSDQKLSPVAIKCLYNLYALSRGEIVAVSARLRDELQGALKLTKRPVRFIPNAVLSARVRQLAETNTDDFCHADYFCSVGRLVEQKGFDLLLQAYARARSRGELPHLFIVGSGDDRAALELQAIQLGVAEHVTFYGHTDNPYYIMKHARAFILSSRHEGMPTALVEAMALDTPVISFDCPTGPGELIRNDVNGILVAAMDVDALADAMLRYRELQGRRISEGMEQFRFEQVATAYMNLFPT